MRTQGRHCSQGYVQLRQASVSSRRRREGRDPLRANLTVGAPAQLWTFYVQFTEVEQAFEELTHDLAARPICTRS